MTLRDFMQGAASCEIVCLITQTVVRKLVATDKSVRIECGDGALVVPLDTMLVHRPWILDRGDVVIGNMTIIETSIAGIERALANGEALKLCTVDDIVRWPDGRTSMVREP